jgi:hypothetical protein
VPAAAASPCSLSPRRWMDSFSARN